MTTFTRRPGETQNKDGKARLQANGSRDRIAECLRMVRRQGKTLRFQDAHYPTVHGKYVCDSPDRVGIYVQI